MLDIEDFYVKYPQYKNRLSWVVYREKGYACLECGLLGTKAALWTDHKNGNPRSVHTDLVGFDQYGELFMITRDHIYPRSKGGPTTLENLQPLCSLCNSRKSDKVDGDDSNTGTDGTGDRGS